MNLILQPILKIQIDEKVKEQLMENAETEGQVIIHCTYFTIQRDPRIRIWESTYLIDKNSDHKSKLLFVDGISKHPAWTYVETRKPYKFSLVFSKLPNSCVVFDLFEEIPQWGGFEIRSILRNSSDVYEVRIT